jgi:DNA recombination protein RmuC
MSQYLVPLIIGLAIGAAVALILIHLLRSRMSGAAAELAARAQEEKAREIEAILERVKGSFAVLSQEALGRSADEFLKLASQALGARVKEGEKELEGKKQLIDQSLTSMKAEMEKVRSLINEFEKDRNEKYGSLAHQLKAAGETTAKLEQTTHRLATALASSRHRGQWGERMAEDVLRLAAFKERIQYIKQTQVEGTAARPDFTFFLPNDLVVNMDVKFPLDNYLKYTAAATDGEKEQYKAQFLKDVQNRIKEVTGREYINPEARTVDYVLVFIPNEQVYAFIWENDPELIDRGLEKKVLLCSPVTLLAILGVIRQAVENFNLEKTTNTIISFLDAFGKQWAKFVESMEKMGERINDAAREYEYLMSTRKNTLERSIRKIDELREKAGIETAPLRGGLPESPAPRTLKAPPEDAS